MEVIDELRKNVGKISIEGKRINECLIKGAKEIEPLDKTELKEKSKCICEVIGAGVVGTGFFCKIEYNDNLVPVLITNYHIINDRYLENNNELKFYINGKSYIIDINEDNIIYSSEVSKFDIIIIQIKENDINDYLEIDENIFKINSENEYKNEQIYVLHYPGGKKASISYGYGIEKIKKYSIKHLCNTDKGSSGGPILSLATNKIIGIHKAKIEFKDNPDNNYNIGSFLMFPLIYLKNKNKILIELEVLKNEINEDIYFLDNTDYLDHKGIKHFHDNLKELNNKNTELYINGEKKEYKKYFRPEKEGNYTILLKLKDSISDYSHMFDNCNNIINIDLSNCDTSKTTKMNYMFNHCESLESLADISYWDTKNVNNMSHMFDYCKSLKTLPDISEFETTYVNKMNGMFSGCHSLKSLPDISKWNIINVNDLSGIFSYCYSLKSLPDISKWNTSNATNMSGIFSSCESLKSLPDISNWNTTNATNMSHLFYQCKELKFLPDISKWDTKNLSNICYMYSFCESLKSLPDISNWNTTNVTNISHIFSYCHSIKFIPDISKWNTMHVTNMNHIFSFCQSLESLPDISKWDTTNVLYMSYMFYQCKSLKSLPDISKWNITNANKMNFMFSECESLESFDSVLREKIEKKFNQKF